MSTTYGLHRALQFDRDATATLFGDRVRSWGEVGERVARLGVTVTVHSTITHFAVGSRGMTS